MFKNLIKKREARLNRVEKARQGFASFRLVSESSGWKVYEDEVEKKMDIIRNQMENKSDLSGEDLKRLQLALMVYKEVQRIPKKLKDDSRGNVKGGV